MASADLLKLHSGTEVSGRLAHIYRHDGKDVTYKNEHIDKTKTHLNSEMRFPEHEHILFYSDEQQMLEDRIKEIDAKEPPIRVRKNRVTLIAFEAPVPEEAKTREEEEAFFKIFYEEVAKMCGGPQNVGVLKIHRDEVHPYIDPATLEEKMSRVHAHCVGIPYVEGKGINSKMFTSRKNLHALQLTLDARCRNELGMAYMNKGERFIRHGQSVEDLKLASAKASRELAEKIITQESRLAELTASIEIARSDADRYREEAQRAKQERDTAEDSRRRTQQELLEAQKKMEEVQRMLAEAENMGFDERIELLRFRDRMLALQRRYPQQWDSMMRSEERRRSHRHERKKRR